MFSNNFAKVTEFKDKSGITFTIITTTRKRKRRCECCRQLCNKDSIRFAKEYSFNSVKMIPMCQQCIQFECCVVCQSWSGDTLCNGCSGKY